MMASFGLDVERLQCQRCMRRFTSPDEFEMHLNTPHPIFRSFYCAMCDFSHANENVVHAHIAIHLKDLPFQCPFCNMTYKFYYSLEFHLHVHRRMEVVACKYCEKTFDASDGGRTCKNHQKTHTGPERYVCLTCEITFSEARALLKHHRLHVNSM